MPMIDAYARGSLPGGSRKEEFAARRAEAPTAASLFYRAIGQGPWLTLLHGFPTYSRDWEALVIYLQSRYRLLLVDLLGYGASDKPQRHRYSNFEHADLIEAL